MPIVCLTSIYYYQLVGIMLVTWIGVYQTWKLTKLPVQNTCFDKILCTSGMGGSISYMTKAK